MIISNQQDNEMEHLNKRIQTVAVLGAGAVGCYLIAALRQSLVKTSGLSQKAAEKSGWKMKA